MKTSRFFPRYLLITLIFLIVFPLLRYLVLFPLWAHYDGDIDAGIFCKLIQIADNILNILSVSLCIASIGFSLTCRKNTKLAVTALLSAFCFLILTSFTSFFAAVCYPQLIQKTPADTYAALFSFVIYLCLSLFAVAVMFFFRGTAAKRNMTFAFPCNTAEKKLLRNMLLITVLILVAFPIADHIYSVAVIAIELYQSGKNILPANIHEWFSIFGPLLFILLEWYIIFFLSRVWILHFCRLDTAKDSI